MDEDRSPETVPGLSLPLRSKNEDDPALDARA
jgi:hypothetical protein